MNRSDANLIEIVTEVTKKVYERQEIAQTVSWYELDQSDRNGLMAALSPIIMDVLEIVEEERTMLAGQIEAQRIVCPVHNMSDCGPLLNGCSMPNQLHKQALKDADIIRKGL